MVYLTDKERDALISEPKPLPNNFRDLLRASPKANYNHEEGQLHIQTEAGNRYRIVLRRSLTNVLDFSVILLYFHKATGEWIPIIRYNGKHSEHTNKIEGQRFYDFHIHKITERYQEVGLKPVGYAEVCTKFSDYRGALAQFLRDLNFQEPSSDQMDLFRRF